MRADAVFEHRRGEYAISTDPARLDLDVIHGFLTNCYWARGIPRETVERSIKHSLCFGIYHEGDKKLPLHADAARSVAPQGDEFQSRAPQHKAHEPGASQVGFARVISDFATIGYLGDVFVLESHRGRGLSQWMMECIMRHPSLQGLRRWILLTRDAHGLYAKFSFTPLQKPDRYMELHHPDVYEIRKTK